MEQESPSPRESVINQLLAHHKKGLEQKSSKSLPSIDVASIDENTLKQAESPMPKFSKSLPPIRETISTKNIFKLIDPPESPDFNKTLPKKLKGVFRHGSNNLIRFKPVDIRTSILNISQMIETGNSLFPRENPVRYIYSEDMYVTFECGAIHDVHRPAIRMPTTEKWYLEGKLHRSPADGPAVITTLTIINTPTKIEEYWLRGKRVG